MSRRNSLYHLYRVDPEDHPELIPDFWDERINGGDYDDFDDKRDMLEDRKGDKEDVSNED